MCIVFLGGCSICREGPRLVSQLKMHGCATPCSTVNGDLYNVRACLIFLWSILINDTLRYHKV
jgi:hypothetical protein